MGLSWFKWRYFLYLFIIGLWSIWFINIRVSFSANDIAISCTELSKDYPVGIVLGASVLNNRASDVFADRLQTAADLYQKGQITKILVSGDHGQVDYDEVNTGKNYLLNKGIPAVDIFLDHAGFDTYDSLYRAKYIFGVDKALIITQEFHLPRALYLAEHLGINTLGCKADLREYRDIKKMKKREILARVKAWLDVYSQTSSKYKGDLYDIKGDGQKTWDQLVY